MEDKDEDAYALLYDRHVRQVATFVARRLGPDEAEDVTAEVFLEAWRQRDHLRVEHDSGLAPWLIAVARNLTAARSKQLVRQRRTTEQLGRDPTLDSGGGGEPPVEQTAARAERARRALATLREDDRRVIDLCVMGELTPSAVAALLGQRPSTVRSRLARARRRLADAYKRVSETER